MRIDANIVKKNNNGEEFYDKFAIAQVIGHIVIGAEASCSMIESGIKSSCSGCDFESICKKSVDTINEMKAAATFVHEEFKF